MGIKLSPKEGWLTFLLLGTSLLVLVRSLEDANWVATPSLLVTVLVAALAGLAFSKLPTSSRYLHPLALLFGSLFVYLQTSTLTEAEEWLVKFQELNFRLGDWWKALIGQGISTDLLPLSLTLTALMWVTGYFSSWALFRHRNVWVPVLIGGLGILTNLSYLPEEFYHHFGLYLLFATVLVAHLSSMKRRLRWERGSTQGPTLKSLLFLIPAFIIGYAAVFIVFALPDRSPLVPSLNQVWIWIRGPVDKAQDEFNRLFAALPSRKGLPARNFGAFLPVHGPAPQGTDPVFFYDAPTPMYWKAKAYTTYTSRGWVAEGAMIEAPVLLPEELIEQEPLPEIFPDQTQISYSVEMATYSPQLLLSGYPLNLNTPYKLEVYSPKTLRIDISNPSLNTKLPSDVQAAASRVSALSTANPAAQAKSVPELLPADLVVTKVFKQQGSRTIFKQVDQEYYDFSLRDILNQPGQLVALEAVRDLPEPADPLSAKPKGRLTEGTSYFVTAAVSTPDENALRGAGTNYPGYIRDAYLQTSDTLPKRVRELARIVAQRAADPAAWALRIGDPSLYYGDPEALVQRGRQMAQDPPRSLNPYDTTVAVEDYLRTFKYNPKVSGQPFNVDVVDYFLFNSREGYSDHFASAMAVMLRSLGIPARLVAGYGPGVKDEEAKVNTVRQKDDHSWTEVYFPSHGWIEFEPTPVYPRRLRGPLALSGGNLLSGAGSGEGGTPLGEEGLMEEELLVSGDEGPEGGRGGPGFLRLPFIFFGSPLGTGGILLGMLLLLAAGVLWVFWRFSFVALPHPELAYEKMCRLTSLMGLRPDPAQTPFEFKSAVATAIPAFHTDIDSITNAYLRRRFGKKHLEARDHALLRMAWARVRHALLKRLLRGV